MRSKKLQYFKGKVCTIFTLPINRNYKEENPSTFPSQMYMYFVGLVEDIDEEGILLTQLQTTNKSYWFWDKIIGIAEEEVVDTPEEVEKLEKIQKEEAEQRAKVQSASASPPSPYVDIEALNSLVKTPT